MMIMIAWRCSVSFKQCAPCVAGFLECFWAEASVIELGVSFPPLVVDSSRNCFATGKLALNGTFRETPWQHLKLRQLTFIALCYCGGLALFRLALMRQTEARQTTACRIVSCRSTPCPFRILQ